MSFSQSWNEATPTNTTEARAIDDEIRQVKTAVRERLAVDHVMGSNESVLTQIGKHRKGSARINFGLAGAKPAVDSVCPGGIYVTLSAGGSPVSVEFDNGTAWLDISDIFGCYQALIDFIALAFESDGTTAKVATTCTDLVVPTPVIGEIIFVPSINAPANFVKANGELLVRADYSDLWDYAEASGNIVSDYEWITTSRFGSFSRGNDSTTFRVLKINGQVIRGYDDGAGVDTDRVIGSYQEDDIKAHTHTIAAHFGNIGSDNNYSILYAGQTVTTSSTGIVENRVKNVALLACIRYQ